MMDAIPDEQASARAQLLQVQTDLKNKLLEILRSKFAFWKTVPWKALGIFYNWETDPRASRERCKECLEEFDAAEASSPGRSHRVAKLLFGQDRKTQFFNTR